MCQWISCLFFASDLFISVYLRFLCSSPPQSHLPMLSLEIFSLFVYSSFLRPSTAAAPPELVYFQIGLHLSLPPPPTPGPPSPFHNMPRPFFCQHCPICLFFIPRCLLLFFLLIFLLFSALSVNNLHLHIITVLVCFPRCLSDILLLSNCVFSSLSDVCLSCGCVQTCSKCLPVFILKQCV